MDGLNGPMRNFCDFTPLTRLAAAQSGRQINPSGGQLAVFTTLATVGIHRDVSVGPATPSSSNGSRGRGGGGGDGGGGWNKGRRFQRQRWIISILSTATEIGRQALYQNRKKKKETFSALDCNYSVTCGWAPCFGNEQINVLQLMSTMKTSSRGNSVAGSAKSDETFRRRHT